MKFYGREKQRKDLHRLFLYEGMQLGLIYGRRRVGKSELIKQSLRETDVTSIYFECKQTTEQNNTESLSVLLADTFHFPKPFFDSMEALLTYLFEAAKEKPRRPARPGRRRPAAPQQRFAGSRPVKKGKGSGRDRKKS